MQSDEKYKRDSGTIDQLNEEKESVLEIDADVKVTFYKFKLFH